MGRTVPTHREVLRKEKEKWKEFKDSLKREEKETFERQSGTKIYEWPPDKPVKNYSPLSTRFIQPEY